MPRCTATNKNGKRCRNSTLKRYPYCWIHCRSLLGVDIKKSHIPDSGEGLYAFKDFKKGQPIAPYSGPIKTTYEIQDEYKNGLCPYCFAIDSMHIVDAKNPADSGMGRYANDCRAANTRASHCSGNNARIYGDRRRHTAQVKAIKPIKKGDEIYASYGPGYWAKAGKKKQ